MHQRHRLIRTSKADIVKALIIGDRCHVLFTPEQLRRCHLKIGQAVLLTVDNGKLILTPKPKDRREPESRF